MFVFFRLGEADLLRLQSGVPEDELFNDLVPIPLGGGAEGDVERFSCRSDHLAVGQSHLLGEGPGGAGDYGGPVTASELGWVWVIVDMAVGESAKHLLNEIRVRFPSFDWLCAPHMCDHVWVMCRVHPCHIAGVESIVALLHEREEVRGSAGVG